MNFDLPKLLKIYKAEEKGDKYKFFIIYSGKYYHFFVVDFNTTNKIICKFVYDNNMLDENYFLNPSINVKIGYNIRFIKHDKFVYYTTVESDDEEEIIYANRCAPSVLYQNNFDMIETICTLSSKEEILVYSNTENINVTPSNITYGTFCRACGQFNNYCPTDNVVQDEKHTCWRCASSPERILIGLNDDFKLRQKQISKLRKINNLS